MDQSHSESDVSLSPSQILQRLQVLRQLQLMQRGKLQKQRLQYQETTETSSTITEIVSQFSNSPSYNTFRSLLRSPQDSSSEVTPRLNTSNLTQKVKDQDLIEGVSILNLSQESEFIINSSVSSNSRASASSRNVVNTSSGKSPINRNVEIKSLTKKQISLDDMPILSPKQDFEALILEKLKTEMVPKVKITKKDDIFSARGKKPFLRRGEGMSRFGLRKTDLVIQNTTSLPWKQKSLETRTVDFPGKKNLPNAGKKNLPNAEKKNLPNKTENKNVEVQIKAAEALICSSKNTQPVSKPSNVKENSEASTEPQINEGIIDSTNCEIHCANANKPARSIPLPKGKQSLTGNKGKTWAAVLTKEQDDFLRQLKQSDYYKNFVSPAKSIISDTSCDDNLYKLRQEREAAEQNMFELLENKVTHESFNIENSFFNKFLKRNKLECSGESTPLIMQKCLANNPALMHIFPDLAHKNRNQNSISEASCNSEYTDCCSDCSCASSCCSSRTVEEVNDSAQSCIKNKEVNKSKVQKGHTNKRKNKEVEKVIESKCLSENQCQHDTDTENAMKADMAEMNAKLVATSELLKDRLHELEDEIETFRKENANLSKLREEVDLERQKFYEEKSAYEQKFNEEKILSEYYLAEEKEKLTNQKQMYERYVREMRGRLNKKEKDEVLNLRKEISDLKEEIRIKDAKSTSTIARLRNQIKIMEKERKDLQTEVEKLKKENRRIHHSNDITRRLTNMKYLEQINKKLTHMSSKETKSEIQLDNDAKYKAYEIERQSRNRKVQPLAKGIIRPRAKSVPNLNVTSRYAKYFSQRDSVSQMDRDNINVENLTTRYASDNDDTDDNDNLNDSESIQDDISDNETNHLEKMYMERFQTSPMSNRSSLNNPATEKVNFKSNPDGFFIRKSNSSSNRDSKSPVTSPYPHNSSGSNTHRTKSPISILSNTSIGRRSPANISKDCTSNPGVYITQNRPKSPLSIFSNRSSSSKLTTVINQDNYRDKLMTVSPEPSTSKTSLSKTNLNPTEMKKPDGSKELRFPNGNVKYVSADGKYSKFVYYNGDVKENFFDEGRIKYYYAEAKTFHTTHADGLEVLEFPDGQVEKRYKDGSSEIRLPNGSIRYFDPKSEHVREEWRFPDGTALTVSARGEQRIAFGNGQVEVHAKDHKRREFPDGTVKLVYNDGTSETRYASGRVRIKDKHGNLIMDSAPG